jgi:hypothetical protein
MNTNSQSPTSVDVRSTQSAKQSSEAPQSLMKSWQHAVSGRNSGGDTNSGSGVDTSSLASDDAVLTGLPDAMQAQLLQERFRQSFDAQGGGANAEVLEGDEEGVPLLNPGANEEMSLAKPSLMVGQNDAAVDVDTISVEQGATERSDIDIEDIGEDNSEDISEDIDEDLDDEDIDETAVDVGIHHGSHVAHETKVEPPQSFLPRDSTDYQWIEKFTDRVLIEVEARAADRNVSIQLSHDVIPNAMLTLSRAGGRWQLNANTDDDVAARGIEDAEQALGARFAARGLGDIQVNVERSREQTPSQTSAFA